LAFLAIIIAPSFAFATYDIEGHLYDRGGGPFLTCGQVKLYDSSMTEIGSMCISQNTNYMYCFSVEPGTYYVKAFGAGTSLSRKDSNAYYMVVVTDSDVIKNVSVYDLTSSNPCFCS